MSIKSILDRFLDLVNFANIYLLPYDGDAQLLSTQTRNVRITGKDLIKQNVENEVHRLRFYDQYLINVATNYVWNTHSNSFQRNLFENLANNANTINNINQNLLSFINNSDTIDRITQMAPQITNNNNSFVNIFFNGVTNFYGKDNPEF
ncbi:hypothetical protein RhiirA5_417095 [Rhizophagus irregularis]|nr:hypothetical protein RhiirA5_417095 [Rhizophagus irregularis]PKC64855.1 hypothetical protein RhiirA1_461835 [Rhizophagus irregularis]PKY28564.1 hypothetical protein RhiirB3_444777 [Rhizophagus irregularis]CAB4493693.1 unnamed protein product [Rhizophagus irregularis]